ncbi:MAG: general secretion pathway protein GspB [Candidatus Velamenicoccus archaeovorus]
MPTLSLSGILYSDAESLALINGKVVPEGGTVDGAKVEKISSDEVELSFEGQKIVLRSR